MTTRFMAHFPERKVTGEKKPATPARGGDPTPKSAGERTAKWPSYEPISTHSYNRKTKVRVVKTTAKKAGLDA